MKSQHWFRYHRGGNALLAETIIEAIDRCGVALEPAQKRQPEGAGLLLFDTVDTQLCETIDQFSRHGFDRVLAVATCSEALEGGAAWRLLEAGAADVFAWDAMRDPAATIAARFERYQCVD